MPDQPRAEEIVWRCRRCRQEITGRRWKCCPEHTSEHIAEDVVCEPCAQQLHPQEPEVARG